VPIYGSSQPVLLYENEQEYLFQNDTVGTGTSSIPAELRRTRGLSYPFGFSVELTFSANPGNFQVDIQTADTDLAANYVTLASITQASVNASYTGRAEVVATWCKFVRLNIVSIANSVAISAKVTR
jgi:hypothetical protein